MATKDPAAYKSYEENSNDIVYLDSTTGKVLKEEDSLRYHTPDDNAVQSNMTDNPALSNAKNRTHIVYLQSADASINDAQTYSGDPIIEAGLRSRAEGQAVLQKIVNAAKPSGAMNKSSSEGPMVEWDQEQ